MTKLDSVLNSRDITLPTKIHIVKAMGFLASSTGKESIVTRTWDKDWYHIRKGVRQGCILSSCFFNLYAEYIMRNAGLDEAQSGNQDCQEKYQ